MKSKKSKKRGTEYMQLGNVSASSMIGMAISGLIAIGLPVFLLLYVKFKEKAKVNLFFIGAAVFVVAVMMLEQVCHFLVFGLTNGKIVENLWLYALYGGLAAAVFEETARFLTLKIFDRKAKLPLDKTGAFLYGIGHGGAESILLAGIVCINSLTTSVMLNSGTLEANLKNVDAAAREQAMTQIQGLVDAPVISFYMVGVERIFALILQIAFSLLMYQAIKQGKKSLILLTYALHFLVDASVVIVQNYLNLVAVECYVAFITAVVGVITYTVWQKYGEKGKMGNI